MILPTYQSGYTGVIIHVLCTNFSGHPGAADVANVLRIFWEHGDIWFFVSNFGGIVSGSPKGDPQSLRDSVTFDEDRP